MDGRDDTIPLLKTPRVDGSPVAALPSPALRRAGVPASELRQWQLREANEHLVIAALNAQQLQAAAELAQHRQTEFLALLAHELRNPLAPLRSGLEAMRFAAGDPETVQEAWEMMDRQVSQLVHLVDDLLDTARIATGQLDLRLERIEIRHAIACAVETSMPHITSAGHALHVDVAPGSLAVDADPLRLAQVFTNLLNNAAKYTPAGGRIAVTARHADAQVVVSISDSGIGIAHESLAAVFGLFTRLAVDARDVHGGLGLGLALVRQLVEMQGGSVTAHSDGPGEGSIFTVRLPLVA